ncbi:MAG: TIR domain-containing protein [Luteitalea sp.]|nr:TIR domain-containing protein [Luteitalea sp.]
MWPPISLTTSAVSMPIEYEGDAFISYAHLDNVELDEGRGGWVTNLQRALEARVAQLYGAESHIWWDPKLQGNDYFADTLEQRLERVKALIAIVSPRYVKSDWGRRELAAFCRAAEQQGGIRVRDKARIFKVLKTPVDRDLHPPELQSLLGYEFFKEDPVTGKMRELDEIFGPDAEKDFWLKLDDLAHDVCDLLKLLPPQPNPAPARGSVYLAVTTAELKDRREAIQRDLVQHGYTVLPDRALPLAVAEVEAAVREDLAGCRLSIHMVGRTYSMVPEGGLVSLAELQNELAIERAAGGRFSRLIWIPPALQVDDERQRRVLDRLRMDPRMEKGADLLETPLEDLRTMIGMRLQNVEKPGRQPPDTTIAGAPPHLYLIYDQRDTDAIAPWADFLFDSFEVIHPGFEGSDSEIATYHDENLRVCHGALIFYGSAGEPWLRGKLRELQKCAAYRETRTRPCIGVCLLAPRTPVKERFRTHEAILIPQWDGFSPGPLQPFVSRLKCEEEPPPGDGTAVPG